MSTESKPGEVTLRVEDHIAVMTVDNVARKNSYSPDMLRQLAQHLTAVEDDDDLWVTVLCSAGPDTTAGLDMPKFFGPGADASIDPNLVDPFGLIRRATKPIVAVVQGLTLTVGIEIMLAADMAVAANTAVFQQLEVARGIAPLGGAHFRYLTHTGWGNAMYHLLRADRFDAREALRLGFVQEVVPYGEHVDRGVQLAREICANAPLGVRATKAAALRYLEHGERAAIAAIDDVKTTVFQSADFAEGIRSFTERRAANFQGR